MKLYDNDIENLFSKTPSVFQNIGTGILSILLIMLLGISYIVRYPDKIVADISLYSESSSVSIVSNMDGRIEKLFFKDGDVVQEGYIIGIIHNTLSYNNYCRLRHFVYNFNLDSIDYVNIDSCGEFNEIISKFSKSVKRYQKHKTIDSIFYSKKISILNMRIKQCKELSQEYKNRNTLYNELQSINTKNFHIDSNMYEQKIISLYDKEKSRSDKIISEIETSESKADYIELKMEENKILESILALKEKYSNELITYSLDVNENLEVLKGQMELWEENYLLKSSINGTLYYSKVWNKNSNINKGEVIYNIIPLYSDNIIGEMHIPLKRAGEIKIGSKVIIKLFDYPYKEYGTIETNISFLSPIADSIYIGTVILNRNLFFTNQLKNIQMKHNMKGKAEIIVEDKSLFHRIFINIQ